MLTHVDSVGAGAADRRLGADDQLLGRRRRRGRRHPGAPGRGRADRGRQGARHRHDPGRPRDQGRLDRRTAGARAPRRRRPVTSRASGTRRCGWSARSRTGSAPPTRWAASSCTDDGIRELPDPSGLFLSRHAEPVPGTCVTVTVEGRRPLVAEVQSLVAGRPSCRSPRRATSGPRRAAGRDGARGARPARPGSGLRRARRLRRHGRRRRGCPSPPPTSRSRWPSRARPRRPAAARRRLCAIGEVGLAGEVRPVSAVGRRLAEAARLGFTAALVPRHHVGERCARRRHPGDRGARTSARRSRLRRPDVARPMPDRRPMPRQICGVTRDQDSSDPRFEGVPWRTTERRALRVDARRRRPGHPAAGRSRADPARQHRRVSSCSATTAASSPCAPAASGSTSSSPPPGCASCAKMDGAIVVADRRCRASCAPPSTWCPTRRSPPRSPAPATAPPSGSPSRPATRSSRSASRCGSSRSTSTAAATSSTTRPRSCPAPTRPSPRSSATSCASTRSPAPCRRSRSRTSSPSATPWLVTQRLEMVRRIADEIEGYVVELGTDGRLLALQLDELMAGVEAERELIVRDYLPARHAGAPAPPRTCCRARPAVRRRELLDLPAIAKAMGFSANPDAPRRAGQPARLPPAGQGAAAARLDRRPARRALRRRCRSCSPPASTTCRWSRASARPAPAAVREGLSRLAESSILERYV